LGSTKFTVSFIPAAGLLWSVGYPEIIRFPAYLGLVLLFALPTRWRSGLLRRLVNLYLALTVLGAALLMVHPASAVMWTVGLTGWVVTVYAFLVERLQAHVRKESLPLMMAHFNSGLAWGVLVNLMAVAASFWIENGLIHRGSGFFIEPSHLGYTLGPAVAYLLFKRGYRLAAAAACGFLIMAAPSGTLAVAIGLGLFLGIASNRMLIVALAFFIAVVIVGGLAPLSRQMLEYKRESTAVWMGALQTAREQLNRNPVLGVGPFAWVSEGERDVDYNDFSTLNQRDLASVLLFIAASFGFFGVGLLLWAVFVLARNSRRNDRLPLLIAVCILTFVARWAGPVPSAFLPLLAMFLAFERLAK